MKKSSIQPLSTTDPEQVVDYLTNAGIGRGLTAEEVRWKYFDAAFNDGRERGFAWMKDGRVRAFIGCIPATRSTIVGDGEMIWTCDWSTEEPSKNPGIGVLLLSKVHKSTEFTAGVGGTADTHATVPRMRTRSVHDVAVTLRRPLRSAPLLKHIEKRLPFLPKLSGTGLGRIPIPVPKRPPGLPHSVITPGVAVAQLAPLFDQPACGIARVRYDSRHLAWLGRYPGAEFRSLHLVDGPRAAGALLWSVPREPGQWRFALRHTPGSENLLDAVIADLANLLLTMEATTVSTMVSSLDHAVLASLKRSRFMEVGARAPLYITDLEGPAGCAEGFADISYLDTDLAFIP